MTGDVIDAGACCAQRERPTARRGDRRSGRGDVGADEGGGVLLPGVVVEGDATREVLDEIVQHANLYSPVANSMRNPIAFQIDLA